MQTIELVPVDADEQYVKHVTLVITGWLLVTFLVAVILAFLAIVTL